MVDNDFLRFSETNKHSTIRRLSKTYMGMLVSAHCAAISSAMFEKAASDFIACLPRS